MIFLFQVPCFKWPLGLPVPGWFAQDQAKASSASFKNEVKNRLLGYQNFGAFVFASRNGEGLMWETLRFQSML